MYKYLGIDPSYSNTGIVIIDDNLNLIDNVLITSKAPKNATFKCIESDNMLVTASEVLELLIQNHKVDYVGIEIPFIPRNMGRLNKIIYLAGWLGHTAYVCKVKGVFDLGVPYIRSKLNFKKGKYKEQSKQFAHKLIPETSKWKHSSAEHLYDAIAVAYATKLTVEILKEEKDE